jgi:hypothetical protein
MRKILVTALATALFAGGAIAATSAHAFVPGPGGFAPGGNGPPPPPPPGFGGPGGFANPQPPGGGGGGGAWPMPPGGGWGNGWGGGFGITIAPQVYAAPQPQMSDPWQAHVVWCDQRWKTYDPGTDMYMSNNGPRTCISPMSPYLQ